MIKGLSDLAANHARRVVIGAGIVFLIAAAIGAPVAAILKSEPASPRMRTATGDAGP